MKIIRSQVMGFCMGVRRAVALAEASAEAAAKAEAKTSGGKIYTLGPLIHNPKILADMESCGIKELKKPLKDMKNSSVIIRAHGIRPDIENDLRSRGARVIDATCPKVKANQLKVREFASAGYFIFLAGEAKHAEIQGILGFAQGTPCHVVSNIDEAEKAAKKLYKKNKEAKAALFGQTTISEEEYSAISAAIKKYFPNLEIIQTICSATKDRQQSLRELLEQVDAALIVGGKTSANTCHLLAIAQESGKPCALVESASEIPDDFYRYEKIGLSAGASTPDSIIDEIEAKMYNDNGILKTS